ncbi:MAG TPA: hypothetical protein VEB86_10385 [Chryseosolibacter sp.]|nr:hypothetical protein [Chryseosolibacter sp.]
MKHAYNNSWLENLLVIKAAGAWKSGKLISNDQFLHIGDEHKVGFYHPNLMIRLLLFLASVIALTGLSGLLALVIGNMGDEEGIGVMMFFYGVAGLIFLDRQLIARSHHYKSGVTEGLLYHSALFMILGVALFSDASTYTMTLVFLIVAGFSAARYLDLISSTVAFCSGCYLVFQICYDAGPLVQSIIPFVFIALFAPAYLGVRKLKKANGTEAWGDCLVLVEVCCIIVVYAAGNYLVVRELSTAMLGLYVEEGQDIPFAYVFYALTVVVPVLGLAAAVKMKDVVLLRVSLLLVAFSVFTFKYYFSLGHHEITFTAGGAILIGSALLIYRYLKKARHGYTAERVLEEKWAEANPEAFVISQTMGGNKLAAKDGLGGGGGEFGGGGSTGSY